MPELLPFKALMPKLEQMHALSGNSTDFETSDSMLRFLQNNPLNFLQLTKMHMVHPELEQNSEAYFKKVQELAENLRSSDDLVACAHDCLYIYRQWIDGKAHTGLVGLVDIVDYENDKIKRHEHTRHEREKFIGKLFDITQMIAQPILMGYRHHQELIDILSKHTSNLKADYHFESPGRIHDIWIVQDPNEIQLIKQCIRSKKALFIMDGHHRISTVDRLYKEHGGEEYRYLMAYLLDEEELKIDPFHRLIQGSDVNLATLLAGLEKNFEVKLLQSNDLHPEQLGDFTLISGPNEYLVRYKGSRPYELDVQLFEDEIAKPIFGIKDSRHDDRIQFVRGDEELGQATEKSYGHGNHLFMLHPCTFKQICDISDRGEVMPPKSTSVEPKCRMGMLVQQYGKSGT